MQLQSITDVASATVTYVGQSKLWRKTSQAWWTVKRVSTSGWVTTTEFPIGTDWRVTDSPVFAWTSRASLNYSLQNAQPPSSVAWWNDGWLVPDSQNTLYENMILVGDIGFFGAPSISVTSLWGWTISGLFTTAIWKLSFDYLTPQTDPDTLRIVGIDKYWFSFSIDLRVDLPF